jgi:hypothetical protein
VFEGVWMMAIELLTVVSSQFLRDILQNYTKTATYIIYIYRNRTIFFKFTKFPKHINITKFTKFTIFYKVYEFLKGLQKNWEVYEFYKNLKRLLNSDGGCSWAIRVGGGSVGGLREWKELVNVKSDLNLTKM